MVDIMLILPFLPTLPCCAGEEGGGGSFRRRVQRANVLLGTLVYSLGEDIYQELMRAGEEGQRGTKERLTVSPILCRI